MPVTAAALALIAFLAAAVPALHAASFGVNHFQDDAFYYVVTAQHFLASGTFAFDGVTATNGFQPLWMGIVVVLLKIAGAGVPPENIVFAIVAAENLCLAVAVGGAVAFCVRSFQRGEPWRTGYLALTAVLLCPLYGVFAQGMETTLAAAAFVLVLQCLVTRRPVALGLAVALLFLCRLDSALFIGLPLLAWICTRPEWRIRVKAYAVLPLAVAMVGDIAINLATTGHAVPISGAIKSSFPRLTWHGGYLVEPFVVMDLYGWRTFAYTLNVVVCGALALAGFALLPFGKFEGEARATCALTGAIALLLLVNLLSFQQWEKSIDPRYLALPMLAAAFFTGSALDACLRRSRAPRMAPAIALLVLALACGSWLVRAPATMQATSDATARFFRDVRAALPADAVLAGTDVGALAFWTQLRVVNLDGVISDFDYQAALRDGKLGDYLRAQGVTHIATALWDREQNYTARPPEPMYRHQVDAAAQRAGRYACHPYYVYSYVHHAYSDRICLREGDEAFRRDLGLDGVAQTSYVVYRLASP